MLTINCKMKDGTEAEVKHLDMGLVPEAFGKTTEYLSLFRVNGKFVAAVSEATSNLADARYALDLAVLDGAGVDVASFGEALDKVVFS